MNNKEKQEFINELTFKLLKQTNEIDYFTIQKIVLESFNEFVLGEGNISKFYISLLAKQRVNEQELVNRLSDCFDNDKGEKEE